MNTYFFNQDGIVNIIEIDNNKLTTKLKPAVYIINKGKQGYFLSYDKDYFELPKRLYGDIVNKSERVKRTYLKKDKQLGVLLVGQKGNGKTLLAKYISNTFIQELKLPVILVNQPFTDNDFIDTLNKIGECVIIFDEFQKTYKNENDDDLQEKLLSFFDGVNSGKRLIIVTENKHHLLNSYMIDRPSRFYYYFDYSKLDEDTIKEVCEDLLVRKDLIPTIVEYSRNTTVFSFDILLALINELNLYPEDNFDDIIDVLNVPMIYDREYIVLKVVNLETNKEVEIKSPRVITKYNEWVTFEFKNGEKQSIYIGNRSLSYEKDDICIFEDIDEGYRVHTQEIQKSVLNKF